MLNYKKLYLGNLPVDLINQYLNTHLDPGTVFLSSKAHEHIAKDHREDYDIALYYLKNAISEPDYIGQGPDHDENFELVWNVPEALPKRELLVGIGLEKDDKGFYRVKSAYLLGRESVVRRLKASHLFKVQK